jgi:hypothetical protein
VPFTHLWPLRTIAGAVCSFCTSSVRSASGECGGSSAGCKTLCQTVFSLCIRLDEPISALLHQELIGVVSDYIHEKMGSRIEYTGTLARPLPSRATEHDQLKQQNCGCIIVVAVVFFLLVALQFRTQSHQGCCLAVPTAAVSAISMHI